MKAEKPVGQTKNQGWEIGVRRTLPVGAAQAWRKITSALGLPSDEGPDAVVFQPGMTFMNGEGARVEIRSCAPGSLLRMKWQPAGWKANTTLQVRVLPAKKGSTISLHHEWLEDAEQREAMRLRWTALLETLV